MRDAKKQTEKSWANNYSLTRISKSDEDIHREANWSIEQALVSGASIAELEETAMQVLIARDRLFRRMLYLKEKYTKDND